MAWQTGIRAGRQVTSSLAGEEGRDTQTEGNESPTLPCGRLGIKEATNATRLGRTLSASLFPQPALALLDQYQYSRAPSGIKTISQPRWSTMAAGWLMGGSRKAGNDGELQISASSLASRRNDSRSGLRRVGPKRRRGRERTGMKGK